MLVYLLKIETKHVRIIPRARLLSKICRSSSVTRRERAPYPKAAHGTWNTGVTCISFFLQYGVRVIRRAAWYVWRGTHDPTAVLVDICAFLLIPS